MKSEHKIIQTETNKNPPFGSRLKSQREELGFSKKEVATKLCLSEKIISMMEHDRYPQELPVTFIRGYLKSYSKLLEIPHDEVTKAIELFKPKSIEPIYSIKPLAPVGTTNPTLRFCVYGVFFCLMSLVLMWWFTTPGAPSKLLLDPSQSVNILADSSHKKEAFASFENELTSDPLESLKSQMAYNNNFTPILGIKEEKQPLVDLYN